jgi:hypothetical protein
VVEKLRTEEILAKIKILTTVTMITNQNKKITSGSRRELSKICKEKAT